MRDRIGIAGGGQLGRMLGMAAKQLGFTVIVLDPNPNCPAGQVVDRQILGHYADPDSIKLLAAEVDFLTFEIEHTDPRVLAEIEKTIPVNPSPATLAIIQDKLAQKHFLRAAGMPVVDFRAIESLGDLRETAAAFGFPLLLKARFGAYDGRGNVMIRDASQLEIGFERLGGRALYSERFVPFQNELAVIAARGMDGQIATYDVVETIHRDSICEKVLAPAPVSLSVANEAHQLAERVMGVLEGAGVFGIEMFLTNDNQVLINEIAPRVHNAGHYTLEACVTSQFEQHIRAIAGLPLGATDQLRPAAMINILGKREGVAGVSGLEIALAIPGVSVHIYGKAETKPERKMGHLTAIAETLDLAHERAAQAHVRISI